MAIARTQIVTPEEAGLYHCISRCVRRAMLCGGNREHRREWLCRRLRELVEVYAIDVVAFAVMSNHLHVLLWTDPDRARSWSDEEVASRWLRLYPKSKPAAARNLAEAARLVAQDRPRIEELRKRLADLSWFMKCLKEPIARRANREDDCTGAFWEGRFKCYRVTDEPGALTCSVYIDLNLTHAGLALTPEDSDFTSVQERIRHRQAALRDSARRGHLPTTAHQGKSPAEAQHQADGDHWLTPFDRRLARTGRRVLFGFGADRYLELVDTLGRIVRGDKRGAIPAHLRPILERLAIDQNSWITAVTDGARRLWGTAVGAMSSLASEAVRRQQSRVVSPFGAVG